MYSQLPFWLDGVDEKVYRPDIDGTPGLNLPNPYPIPNTPFNITFNPPQRPLIHEDVVDCLKQARSEVVSHIKEHGDGPIPNGEAEDPLFYPYKTVIFDIYSNELPEPYGGSARCLRPEDD
ncbi:MAG: hypothetical protein Q9204_006098 [Flavoplaca sp. TL-2023a]